MTLLVLDGNSIINRAFYGIKLLTTKQGDYTNAIYGFLNMMLKFEDMCKPDAVAVAFDMHAPTFRHKMYDEYKAGRHAMPAMQTRKDYSWPHPLRLFTLERRLYLCCAVLNSTGI